MFIYFFSTCWNLFKSIASCSYFISEAFKNVNVSKSFQFPVDVQCAMLHVVVSSKTKHRVRARKVTQHALNTGHGHTLFESLLNSLRSFFVESLSLQFFGVVARRKVALSVLHIFFSVNIESNFNLHVF